MLSLVMPRESEPDLEPDDRFFWFLRGRYHEQRPAPPIPVSEACAFADADAKILSVMDGCSRSKRAIAYLAKLGEDTTLKALKRLVDAELVERQGDHPSPSCIPVYRRRR